MEPRIAYWDVNPPVYKALQSLSGIARQCGLDQNLIELVFYRASQLNGCAFCLNMHAAKLQAAGAEVEKLLLASAWRDAGIFSAREQSALEWTEAVTRLTNQDVPEDVYQRARREFDEKELVGLTTAVVAINGWNRFNVAFRVPPQPVKAV